MYNGALEEMGEWMGEMEMDRNEEKYKTEKHGFCFILCCSCYHSLKAVTMSFNLNSNRLKTLTVSLRERWWGIGNAPINIKLVSYSEKW